MPERPAPRRRPYELPRKQSRFPTQLVIAVAIALVGLIVMVVIVASSRNGSGGDQKSSQNGKREVTTTNRIDPKPIVLDWLNKNLDDPSELEILGWGTIEPLIPEDGGGIRLKVKYRTKNRVGGRQVEQMYFAITNRGDLYYSRIDNDPSAEAVFESFHPAIGQHAREEEYRRREEEEFNRQLQEEVEQRKKAKQKK